MLHGEQGGRRTRGGSDLRVDPLDVGFRSLGGDGKALGGLAGGCAAGDECEYLDLAWRQSGRSSAPSTVALSSRRKDRVDRVEVEAARMRPERPRW